MNSVMPQLSTGKLMLVGWQPKRQPCPTPASANTAAMTTSCILFQGAAQTPATRGDQVPHQTCWTIRKTPLKFKGIFFLNFCHTFYQDLTFIEPQRFLPLAEIQLRRTHFCLWCSKQTIKTCFKNNALATQHIQYNLEHILLGQCKEWVKK